MSGPHVGTIVEPNSNQFTYGGLNKDPKLIFNKSVSLRDSFTPLGRVDSTLNLNFTANIQIS